LFIPVDKMPSAVPAKNYIYIGVSPNLGWWLYYYAANSGKSNPSFA